MVKILKYVLSVGICLAAGALGTIFTISSIPTWYAHLIKPSFSPPNWLFGPVWTILYILMGVSVAIIWSKGLKAKKVREAVYLFIIQLFLNAIWTPIFFGAKDLFLSLIVIGLMWIFILKTILAFGKVNKTASYLLYPYIAWVSFASILNFSVWILNK
ncbi:MAG TPA: TspO/MBR family protein [Candidatus Saccharimonadales bacterium]|jgi:tryptophan-rich sensory protein|nr:TspO/MBR family protein [Candidatus Saccharimonadales bacterium]